MKFLRRLSYCLLCYAVFVGMSAIAAPVIAADSATTFFTNVASRLISRMDVDLTHIPIYPTNGYTPAVHRLLQLTANIYDATTTNSYPTIFRPQFTSDGTNLFISGYEQLDSTNLSALTLPFSSVDAANLVGSNFTFNVYGIPWILGAKKGLPNFNEVALDNVFTYMRKLQIVRVVPGIQQEQVNQMLLLNVSNALGIELWNSYKTNYPGNISIQVDASLSLVLTNDYGVSTSNGYPFSRTYALATNWPGGGSVIYPKTNAFQIPFATNITFVPISAFRVNPPGLVAITNLFETGVGFLNPHWALVTAAKMRCAIIDSGPPARIIDYVQLDGPTAYWDLNRAIEAADIASGFYSLWSTNWVMNYLPMPAPSGVVHQMEIGLGQIATTDADWAQNMSGAPSGTFRTSEIQQFYTFYNSQSVVGSMVCPFIPTRKIQQSISWQANDPLVHYIATDFPPGFGYPNQPSAPDGTVYILNNIGQFNRSYRPWGGNPFVSDAHDYDLALKDPLILSSDDWDFPTNQALDCSWLGRVHRGTPWQTINLKSVVAATNAWEQWTGLDPAQAALTNPTNDWQIAADWAIWLNTNSLTSRFSVNNPDPNAWQSRLDGLVAFTNSAAKTFDPIVISSNSPQAAVIANAIEAARSTRPGQLFNSVADVLATPELTFASPWLNIDLNQIDYGINDEAYEAIPSQLLPLLRADSIASISVAPEFVVSTFTGYDGHGYIVQGSSNLLDWVNFSTNYPVDGVVSVTNAGAIGGAAMFYRSMLLPDP